MKKTLVIILFSLAAVLAATSQFSYQMQLEDEALINSVNSYYSGKIAGISFANSSALRYAAEDYAESTYLSRYLRNRLWLNKAYNKLDLAGFFYFGIYAEGNVASHLPGIVQPQTLENSWGGGFAAKYEEQYFRAELKLKNLVDHYQTDLTDADLLGNLEISARNLSCNPYLKLDYYSDLNSDKTYDYQELGIGLKSFHKISFAQFLTSSVEVGNSTIYEDIPYYTRLKSRLTTKLGQNWFFLNRIDFAAYLSDDLSEIYDRKSFTEHFLQYNYARQGNRKNYLNFGLKASLQGDLSGQVFSKYCLEKIDLSLGYQHYINEAESFDGKIFAAVEYIWNQNISLLISNQFSFSSQTNQNKLIILARMRR